MDVVEGGAKQSAAAAAGEGKAAAGASKATASSSLPPLTAEEVYKRVDEMTRLH